MEIDYQQLTPRHFNAVIQLGNQVHGENYLDENGLTSIYEKSWHNNINASWVALDDNFHLVGFRLTFAAPNWQQDKWCTPEKWPFTVAETCYFKCNTVAENARGQGIGATLLKRSIGSAMEQGARAGLAHIWMASPNNSAFEYFRACGGEVVAMHPKKWQQLCIDDNYQCPICADLCICTAAEMLITF